MAVFNLKINGKVQKIDVDPSTPILWVLRDHLNLQGTKYGCGVGMCGACTVHLNGSAVRSCQLPVSTIGKQTITTVEGLSSNAMSSPKIGLHKSMKTYGNDKDKKRFRL